VMAMTDLARHGEARAVSLAEIAVRQEISQSYLEQLFAKLRKGGLVRSVRGPGGGYRLAAAADATPIAAIVQAVDEPLRATRCSGPKGAEGCMMRGEKCLTHDLWEALSSEIEAYLTRITLADVAQGRLRTSVDTDRTAAA